MFKLTDITIRPAFVTVKPLQDVLHPLRQPSSSSDAVKVSHELLLRKAGFAGEWARTCQPLARADLRSAQPIDGPLGTSLGAV